MFKSLLEFSELTIVRLTDVQKAVLMLIYSAQTPELGYESATGTIFITNARDYLLKIGLIISGTNQLKATSTGSDTLEANGLINAAGESTDLGNKLIDAYNNQKRKFTESLEPFRTFKNKYNGEEDLSLVKP